MNSYSLTVRNVKDYAAYSGLLETIKEFDLVRYVFDEGCYFSKENEAMFCTWEPQNWERYNGQMIIISEKHPHMIFELTVQHEDTFWRTYYEDGQTETCIGEVVFESPQKIKWAFAFQLGTELSWPSENYRKGERVPSPLVFNAQKQFAAVIG